MIEPSRRIQFHVQVVPALAPLLEHDTIPVMRQCFPTKHIKTWISFSKNLSTGSHSPEDSSESYGHPVEALHTESSLPDRVFHDTAPYVFNTSTHAAPPAHEYYPGGKHVIYEEWSRNIRSRPEKIHYYRSEGLQRIEFPPTIPSYYSHGLVHGHIFVHKYSNKPDVQTWIWNGTSWSSITTGCQHPSLANYEFNVLHNGEPSWITRKSAITYQSKRKPNWTENKAKNMLEFVVEQ